MNNEEELQQKFYFYKQLEEQIKALAFQLDLLQNEISKIETAFNALKNLSSKSEILVALSDKIFIKARVENLDKVLLNVGSNVFLERDIKEVENFVEKFKKEIEEEIIKVNRKMQQYYAYFKALEEEIQRSVSSK